MWIYLNLFILSTADGLLGNFQFETIMNRAMDFLSVLGGALVKNPPINAGEQETWVWSLGWEDPLEEGMATHSSILAWRIPTDRRDWWATVHRAEKSQT